MFGRDTLVVIFTSSQQLRLESSNCQEKGMGAVGGHDGSTIAQHIPSAASAASRISRQLSPSELSIEPWTCQMFVHSELHGIIPMAHRIPWVKLGMDKAWHIHVNMYNYDWDWLSMYEYR